MRGRALLALSLLLAGTAAALAPLPLPGAEGGLRVGDTLLYYRQTWVEHENGTVDETFGPSLALHLRDVRALRDGDGVARPTLLLDAAWRPLLFTPEGLVEGTPQGNWQTASILADARTGEAFGAYVRSDEGRSEELRFAHGGLAAMDFVLGGLPPPCALSEFLRGTLGGAPMSAGRVGNATCAALETRFDARGEVAEAPAGPEFPPGTRVLYAGSPEAPSVYLWLHADAPAPLQLASAGRYRAAHEDANLTAVEYLAAHRPGDGPRLEDALADLALPPPLPAPVLAPFTRFGPAGAGGTPFPLDEAMRLLREHPNGTFLRTYLDAHPDAFPSELSYNEWTAPNGTWMRRSWYAVWSDPAGEGAFARVDLFLRVEDGRETPLPPEVGELTWWKDAGRVHRLGLGDLPGASVTVEEAARIARAYAPPALAFDLPNDVSLVTVARTGERSVSGGGYDGPATFHEWQLYLGQREVLWGGAGDEVVHAGGRAFSVQLDPATGRVARVATGGEHVPYEPVLEGGVAPFYDQPVDALRIPAPSDAAPRFAAAPTWRFPSAGVAGAAAAAVGGVALLTLLTATGRELLARGVVVPLYARLSPERSLRHPTRRALLDALRAEPGAGAAGLAATLSLPEGTVRHHLRALRRASLVREVRAGGRPGYALAGVDPATAAKGALLRHPHARAVLEAVRAHPGGARLMDVVAATSLGTGAAYHHLVRLVAGGALRMERTARGVRFFPDGMD